MKITSINNPLIKELQKLKIKKYRSAQQLFLVEGYHLVNEAYHHGVLKNVLAVNVEDLNYNVTTYQVTEEIIKKLSSTEVPQPIIGVVKMIEPKLELKDKILLLDDIKDPGNLGTIIRTAAALGIDNIILSESTVDLYNDKVIRATQGALFKVPINQCSLKEIITELKNKKIPVYGSSLSNGISLKKVIPIENFALIMGNEARGISDELLNLTSSNIYIPMQNNVESLNVGIAAAIIIYHLTNVV